MKRSLKIISKIFFCLIILLISVMLIFAWFPKTNSKYYGDNSKVLKSDKVDAKKALIVYQPSRSQLTSKIAEKIAEGINDGGYEVTINNPGKHMPEDISQYSIVVFGSPVYMGQTSETLSEYMNSIKKFSKPKILLFATGSVIDNGELEKMESQLYGRQATEKVEFKNGMKDENKAYEIGKAIAGE